MGFGAVHINNPDKSRWKNITITAHALTTCSWYTIMTLSSIPSDLTISSPIHVLSGIDTDHYGVVNYISGNTIYVWWADGNKAPESYSGTINYSEKGYFPSDFPLPDDEEKWSLTLYHDFVYYTFAQGGTRYDLYEVTKPIGVFMMHLVFVKMSHQNPYWPALHDVTDGNWNEFYGMGVERYFPDNVGFVDKYIESNEVEEKYNSKTITVASQYQFIGNCYTGLKIMPKFEAAA